MSMPRANPAGSARGRVAGALLVLALLAVGGHTAAAGAHAAAEVLAAAGGGGLCADAAGCTNKNTSTPTPPSHSTTASTKRRSNYKEIIEGVVGVVAFCLIALPIFFLLRQKLFRRDEAARLALVPFSDTGNGGGDDSMIDMTHASVPPTPQAPAYNPYEGKRRAYTAKLEAACGASACASAMRTRRRAGVSEPLPLCTSLACALPASGRRSCTPPSTRTHLLPYCCFGAGPSPRHSGR